MFRDGSSGDVQKDPGEPSVGHPAVQTTARPLAPIPKCLGSQNAPPDGTGHWYYDVAALQRDFGIFRDFQSPRPSHPNSIMALASTGGAGRGSQEGEVVGSVILHGRKHRWELTLGATDNQAWTVVTAMFVVG